LTALLKNEKATDATDASDTFPISLYSLFLFSRVKSKKRSVAPVAPSHLEHGHLHRQPRLSPQGRGRVTQPLDGGIVTCHTAVVFSRSPAPTMALPDFPVGR
jgi:hypothetical protein